MKSKQSAIQLSKHIHPILSTSILVLSIGLIIGILLTATKKQTPIISNKNSIPTIPIFYHPHPSLVPSPTLTPIPLTILMYTSPKLRISFRYAQPFSTAVKAFTKEINNKIYLYFDQQEYKGTDEGYLSGHGYYLEVFHKDPHDSLVTAIKKQFLQEYSEHDCFVQDTTQSVGASLYPPNYQFAEITLNPNDALPAYEGTASKCPSPYTRTNAITYFLADPSHPDKFVFIGPHQSVPMADDKHTWDETITFF